MLKILDKTKNYIIIKYKISEYNNLGCNNKDFPLDFKELEESEITQEMKEMIEETKKNPKELLCNV